MLWKHRSIFLCTILPHSCSCFKKSILNNSTLSAKAFPASDSYLRNYACGKTQNRHINVSKFIAYCNSQISKKGKSGNIQEAESLFSRMPSKNTVTWTALLTAYAENNDLVKARKVFDEMTHRSVTSWNAMITAYIRNNLRTAEAHDLFTKMPERNAVSYAAMITGFTRAGMFEMAEELYDGMPIIWRDPVCSNALISGYLKAGKFDKAILVFEGMVEKDVITWSSMIDGYCKGGKINDARKMFDLMPEKNVVSWTSMIDGYMKAEKLGDGFKLFSSMRRVDNGINANPRTLTIIFDACANLRRQAEGSQMHGLVSRMGFLDDLFLSNSILNMYGKCGCTEAADKVFLLMSVKDVVSWNSLIGTYVTADKIEEAHNIFCIIPEKDMVTWTTMIVGFSKRGLTEKSIQLFNIMPQKDNVAWTAVISGFVNNGLFSEAIHWYNQMTRRAIRPNVITLSSLMSAAAGLTTLNQGSQIHAHAMKMHVDCDLYVQNALVTMYSKCGSISDAYQAFRNIKAPNIVSFNSMITAFAQHGLGQESLGLFTQLLIEEHEPNQITFLAVLSACTHMGLVEEGKNYFESMRYTYQIEPGPDHYACMVDLLGRAGLLEQAIDIIHSMPFEPSSGVWGALLSAGKSHMRTDMAKLAAKHLFVLNPDNVAPYVVLSSLYSVLGEKYGEQVILTGKLKEVKKCPGCSWIVVNNRVHLFYAGDHSYNKIGDVVSVLWTVSLEMTQTDSYIGISFPF